MRYLHRHEDYPMLSSDKLLRKAFEQDHPYVVGLDVSLTSTGVYFLSLKRDDAHPDFHYHLTSGPKDGLDSTRIDNICRLLETDLTNPLYPVIAACIEDYGPSGRIAGKVLVRAELCGILKHLLRNVIGVPYLTLSPNGLKKFATGLGRGDKTVTIAAAHDLGFITKNSDQADAFHAARFCEAYLKGQKLSVSYNRVNPKSYTF
jgi:Holliday junction resolvasome RuvABC endonuclease subunit